MKILFKLNDEPVSIWNGILELATFSIEMPLLDGGNIEWRGWSVRQKGKRVYVQGPLMWAKSTNMTGPCVLYKGMDSKAFLDRLRLLIKLHHGIEIPCPEARPLSPQTKKKIVDPRANKGVSR